MSSYSTQLMTIIDRYSSLETTLSTAQRIESGRPKLFDFDYPLFDPLYKKIFETNFIRNFYMSEIGFETEGLFKMKLENWLNINMPYYNKLFLSELIEFNPLYNVDWSEKYDKNLDKNQKDNRKINQDTEVDETAHSTSTNDAKSHQDSDNFNREIFTDTPQSRLELTTKDGTGVVEYASNITENKGTASADATSSNKGVNDTKSNSQGEFNSDDNYVSDINQVEDYLRHVQGKQGNQSYSSMINEYRSTFLRIERDILEECKQLFMLLY